MWDEAFTSPTQSFAVPATLRLYKKVNKKWKPPRFRKKVLFSRDKWRCQYCGVKLGWHNVEVEHVHPSSRGGQTSWTNCVTACRPCNKKKANKTPAEASMRLLKQPTNPTALHFWDAAAADAWHSSWETFLPQEAEPAPQA